MRVNYTTKSGRISVELDGEAHIWLSKVSHLEQTGLQESI